jgi:hypothetical protein
MPPRLERRDGPLGSSPQSWEAARSIPGLAAGSGRASPFLPGAPPAPPCSRPVPCRGRARGLGRAAGLLLPAEPSGKRRNRLALDRILRRGKPGLPSTRLGRRLGPARAAVGRSRLLLGRQHRHAPGLEDARDRVVGRLARAVHSPRGRDRPRLQETARHQSALGGRDRRDGGSLGQSGGGATMRAVAAASAAGRRSATARGTSEGDEMSMTDLPQAKRPHGVSLTQRGKDPVKPAVPRPSCSTGW